MHVEGRAVNHKKSVCADGAFSKKKDGSIDEPPAWPQPKGIFTEGKSFNAMKFLFFVHDLYERLRIEHADQDGNVDYPSTADLQLEDIAFSKTLEERSITLGDHVYFRLFKDLELIGGSYDSLVSFIEGRPADVDNGIKEIIGGRYLRLDCLNLIN